jgi:hypothetical protein
MIWIQQEAGWLTSELGGICREKNGKWYFYPASGESRTGPYTSATAAKRAVKR